MKEAASKLTRVQIRWIVGGFIVLLIAFLTLIAFKYVQKAKTKREAEPSDHSVLVQTLSVEATNSLCVGMVTVTELFPSNDAESLERTAFLRWRPHIKALHKGEDIYAKYEYPNPPIMALVLTPLMDLHPVTGGVVWLLLKAVMATLMFLLIFRMVAGNDGPYPWYAAIIATIFSLHSVAGDLSHGNVNIFIGFVVVVGLECYRRGWDYLAGIVIALAIACKVTPLLFLGYFGWKVIYALLTGGSDRIRLAWQSGTKVLIGCVVGLVIWLLVVPGAFFGWERNLSLIDSWYKMMVKPFIVEGKVTAEHINESLPGITHRLFTHSPSAIKYQNKVAISFTYHTIVDLGPEAARWICRGWQMLFVLCVAVFCRTPIATTRSGYRIAAEFALIFLGMLLLSERTWKHHAVTICVPVAVLTYVWAKGMFSRRAIIALQISMVAVILLTLVPSIGGKFQDDCLAYGSHTAIFLILFVWMCVVLSLGERRA